VREKYCWLAGGWWLVLNWCERKALLAGWEPASRTRPRFRFQIDIIDASKSLDFIVFLPHTWLITSFISK
jgi:hypothetical protein